MYDGYGLFIAGQWRSQGGGGRLEVADPATGEVIGTVPSAAKADVEEAIASAAALIARKVAPALAAAEAPFGGCEGIHDYLNVKLAQITL